MNWTELLTSEIETNFRITDALMDLVDADGLDWKPSQDNNWMTMGQLLMHLTTACGLGIRGFATGDWGLPDGVDMAEMSPEEMMPSAEKLPTIGSVAEAKEALAKDKQVALETLAGCSEERLNSEPSSAPWDPTEMLLGHRLLQMAWHLSQHKDQLFYYLKLQGKLVNTSHLWGM
jgi:hypothetical protein